MVCGCVCCACVCDVFKRVWFDCGLLCDGVWSVLCVGLCVRVVMFNCVFVLICLCYVCLNVLVCFVCGVCLCVFYVFACFRCDVLCDVFMINGVLLSRFVLCCCVFARVGFNGCVLCLMDCGVV